MSTPSMPALNNTFGAMFVGVMIGASLFGVTCVQTWHYFNSNADNWLIKTLVGLVWTFDTLHQILISHTLYTYVITNFANPMGLRVIIWSLVLEVLVNGFVGLLVKLFFTFRVWRLSKHNFLLVAPILLMVLAEFGFYMSYTVIAFQLTDTSELPKMKDLSIIVNVLAAVSDFAIAVSMVYLLSRNKTGYQSADSVVNRLMMFVLRTGILTSACALACLISILAWPKAYIYICFFFLNGRLYANSLLVTLNNRPKLLPAPARAAGAPGGPLTTGAGALDSIDVLGTGMVVGAFTVGTFDVDGGGSMCERTSFDFD